MPVDKTINRPWDFGPDCVFAVTDWLGFAGVAAKEYATITGTLNEVKTPYGTGIQVGVANSYVRFNATARCPLGATPFSIFTQFSFPSNGLGLRTAVSWGATPLRQGAYAGVYTPTYGGGLFSDDDIGGAYTDGAWTTMGVTNTGVNGGANRLYAQGALTTTGANAGDCASTSPLIHLFSTPGGGNYAPAGSVLQTVIVMRRVLSDAEMQALHNWCAGLRA